MYLSLCRSYLGFDKERWAGKLASWLARDLMPPSHHEDCRHSSKQQVRGNVWGGTETKSRSKQFVFWQEGKKLFYGAYIRVLSYWLLVLHI
jgi:hypothetical protein